MESKSHRYRYFSSFKVALIFFLVGAAFIYFSDRALFQLIEIPVSPQNLIRIQTYKDIGFIFLAAVLLFILIRRENNAGRKYIRLLENQKNKLNRFAAEKDKAKTRLNERNRFIETVLKNLPIGIAINKTDDKKAVFLNDRFASIYGWPENELKDVDSFFEKIYPDEKYRKEMKKRIQRDVESGIHEKMKWENVSITTKEGTQKIINVQNFPIPGQNYMISTVQDVTGKNRIERKVKESKNLLEKTINNLNEVVIVADRDRNVLMTNLTIQKIFGYRPEEIVGRQTGMLHANEEMFNQLPLAGREELEKKGVYHTRYPMKHKDGTVIDTEITTSVILEKDGWQSGTISVIRDITEQLKYEHRLQQYQDSLKQLTTELSLTEEKQRKKIAANIHDHLSQLLVVSKMKLEGLEKELNSGDAKKVLTIVKSYISEALENSRKITYDLSPPVLYELGLVETMHWMMEKVEEEQGIDAIFKSDVEKVEFPESKRILVFRIIQELVNNVLKHARAEKLEIVFRKIDSELQVTVEDNGKSFNPEELTESRFQKGEFGLFAVKERVKNLGGKFSIHSEPGKGTTVKFSIP